MRLCAFILLVPTTVAFPSLSSAQTWLASFQQPLLNLISNSLQRSTIPQFILDTSHPWILANQRRLESLPKVVAFLRSDPDFESNEPTSKETKTCSEEPEIPPDLSTTSKSTTIAMKSRVLAGQMLSSDLAR